MSKLISEQEAAEQLGVSIQTMRRWRSEGRDLPWARIGNQIRYRQEDVTNFVNAAFEESSKGKSLARAG